MFYFNYLKQNVIDYDLFVDSLHFKVNLSAFSLLIYLCCSFQDVKLTAVNDDQLFVFEDCLYQVNETIASIWSLVFLLLKQVYYFSTEKTSQYLRRTITRKWSRNASISSSRFFLFVPRDGQRKDESFDWIICLNDFLPCFSFFHQQQKTYSLDTTIGICGIRYIFHSANQTSVFSIEFLCKRVSFSPWLHILLKNKNKDCGDRNSSF